jgi:hypothetical protein
LAHHGRVVRPYEQSEVLMARQPWKLAGALAIGYVVLELVSVSIGSKVPELGASRADVVADFGTGSASKMYAAIYVTGLAILVFATLASFVAYALRETSAGWAATTSFAAAIVYVATNAGDPALLGALVYGGHHGADPASLMLLNDVRNLMLDASLIALGAFTVAAAVAVLRSRALPAWIAYAGLVSGVLLFVPMALGPAFLLNLVWMVALGIVMVIKRHEPAVLDDAALIAA